MEIDSVVNSGYLAENGNSRFISGNLVESGTSRYISSYLVENEYR